MRLLVLLTLMFSVSVQAIEFKQLDYNTYEMRGYFDEYSYGDIAKFIMANNNKNLLIVPYSNGGYAADAIKIMRIIESHGSIAFVVRDDAFCNSMCAFAASAATLRYGKFGFHPIAYKEGILPRMSQNHQLILFNLIIRDKLKSYGMDQDLAKEVTMKVSRELTYVHFNGTIDNVVGVYR